MKIELKKLKVFEAGSEETNCFTADIWIDGRYQGSARNDGRGGSHIISPPSLERILNDWGKQLPPYNLGIPSHEDPTKPMMVDQDAESLINDLVQDFLNAKDLKKIFRTKVAFTRPNQMGIFTIKTNCKPEVFIQNAEAVQNLRTRHNAEQILNMMPFEEALQIYIEKGK